MQVISTATQYLKSICRFITDNRVNNLDITNSGVKEGYPFVDLETGERFYGYMAQLRHAIPYYFLNKQTRAHLDKRAYWVALDTLRSYREFTFDREKYYSVNEGDIVLQVGAYHGHDTLRFSRAVGDSGKVISVEASESNFEILSRNVDANNINNVELINAALSDSAGTITLYDTSRPGKKDISYVKDNFDYFNYNDDELISKTVEKKRADDLLEKLAIDEIDYTVVTVNGAEADVLRGLGDYLTPDVAVVAIAHLTVDGIPLYETIQELLKSRNIPAVVEKEEIGEVVYAGPGVPD